MRLHGRTQPKIVRGGGQSEVQKGTLLMMMIWHQKKGTCSQKGHFSHDYRGAAPPARYGPGLYGPHRYKGATIRYLGGGGGAGVFAWPFFFNFTREMESLIFSPHMIGCNSTMHCAHLLFHPFSSKKYLFPTLHQFPNGGPLTLQVTHILPLILSFLT